MKIDNESNSQNKKLYFVDVTLHKKFRQKYYLILTFWGHGQLDPYVLVEVNLVLAIFNLRLI